MANFFSDNKDLQFHLQHPMMRKIVELKERGFAEKDLYDFAPQDFEDAMDSYRRVLEIAGEICGEVIAPNAEGVDHEGPRVVNDHVEYASGTVENMKAVVDAGLSGMTLPRKYDGLNFPLICFCLNHLDYLFFILPEYCYVFTDLTGDKAVDFFRLFYLIGNNRIRHIIRITFIDRCSSVAGNCHDRTQEVCQDFFFIYLFFLLQTFYFHPFHSIFIRLDQCKYETLDYKECDQCISNLV